MILPLEGGGAGKRGGEGRPKDDEEPYFDMMLYCTYFGFGGNSISESTAKQHSKPISGRTEAYTMPPKSTPSQAGKFRPLKRPVKKIEPPLDTTSSGAADHAADGSRARDSGRSPAASAGRDGGGSRGRGGRGGRGGGRFVIPSGRAFFTGEAAKRGDTGGVVVADGGTDGRGITPRFAASSSTTKNTGRVASSTAARVKMEEGEEIIVGEMMDVDDYRGGSEEGGGGRGRTLDESRSSKRTEKLSRVYGENQLDEDVIKHADSFDPYFYDSDSSMEVETIGRRKKQNGYDVSGDFTMPPTQLPFPIAPHQQTMYDCQEERFDEEKKMSDGDVTVTNISSKLSDPPLRLPFLNLASVSEELKQVETMSWFLMKFPTRLPLFDASSPSTLASKKKAGRVKAESYDEYGDPDANIDTSTGRGASFLASPSVPSGPLGFDDTLKDTAAGRYGKIVVRKSGKTELIIGGGGGSPKVRSID